MLTNRTPIVFVIILAVFACFLPFISFGNVNLYVSEVIIYISAPFLIFTRFRINYDLFMSLYILAIIGLFHGISNNNVMDAIIPIRMLVLFYTTFILMSCLSHSTCRFVLTWALSLICAIYTIYILNVALSLISGKVSILDFLYNYDLGRIKAFYENGTTSVVIGSLLSILFSIVLCSKNINNRRLILVILFVLGVFTASRANILSNVVALVSYHVMSKPNLSMRWVTSSLFLSIVVVLGLYIVLLKMLLAGVQIDGSASTRLRYYLVAINSATTVRDLLFGHGFAEEVLYSKFNISFFESFFFNTYMQAGLIGLFAGTYFIIRIVMIYKIGMRSTFSILSGLFLGNVIGGANVFSIFVLPFMLLGLRFLQTEK